MAITDGLITLADARASLQLGTADTTRDTVLERYIEAATPVIEAIAGPQLVKARTLTFDGGRNSYLLPYKIASVTSVTVSGVAVTDYTADLESGIVYAGTYPGASSFGNGLQNVVIVVSVGNATIPPNVLLAARELVRHWWQQGFQANRPSFGNEATDSPTVLFGVPTRRLQELLAATPNVGGFA